MLSLKKLTFSGIGRFAEEQVIDFTKLGNLVQVDAQYVQTGGSSGAGKSTFLNAIDFNLGLNDIPNGMLQSRVTKNGISVITEWDWDGKDLVIKRTKKGLSVKIGADDPIEGSSKLAEEKLDEILAMPRHLFRQILHKRQKEGGFFLNFTPKQIHEFLTDALGLEGYREKLKTLEIKAMAVTGKQILANNSVSTNQATLTATQNALASMGQPPVQEVTRESVLQLKSISDSAESDMKLLQQAHSEAARALEATRPQVTVKPFDRSQIDKLEAELKNVQLSAETMATGERERQALVTSELNKLRIERMRLDTVVSQGTKAHAEAVTVASEIKRIRESICPTCDQHWATESAKRKEQTLLTKVKELKEVIANGNKAAEELVLAKLKIADLEPQLLPRKIEGLDALLVEKDRINADLNSERAKEKAHQSQEVAKSRVLMDEFFAKANALAGQQNNEMQHVRAQYDIARRAFDTAVNKMKMYDEAKKRYETQKVTLEASLASPQTKIDEAKVLLASLEEELSLIEESKKLIKSFMSCSFDDSLEYIGTVATTLIRSIPNMANATVQLEGVKETKEGKIKEEVNAVLNIDGESEVPIKSLSGGERSALDLAIDLAVIDLIESKTNKGIDVFILDEPFTGLDTVCIEMALEVLKNSSLNKKLLIVDHNPVIKESLSDRILVIRDGETSRIEQ